ncbi:MAG: substrate-binding domain-containing protein [Solobacterium sp.]|nr:substrate-binding domain-containing protein [Solobacterium sp.]
MKNTLKVLCAAVLFAAVSGCRKSDSDQEKYGGHGFKYMHGWSSTDFTGYHVYDGEKLAVLDHEASLQITDPERMPVLDGAEACYPLYAAAAKAVYKDIGSLEKQYMEAEDRYDNGKIVTFTNTVMGYDRLVGGQVDIIIAAGPSQNQKDMARSSIEQIRTVPIGREAFVFFVEEDNPVDTLTAEQIRKIYSGEITNWKDVGGKDQKITAFQRPEDSGSQVMMRYFMGDVPLMEPKTYETINAMEGVVQQVAQYHNEAGAFGYTFKYFLTGLNQEKHVKILRIDDIEPTAENIRSGRYPAIANVVAATLVSNNDPDVRAMVEFFLSKDGQELVEKTGYAALPDPKYEERIENNLPSLNVYQSMESSRKIEVNAENTYSGRYIDSSGNIHRGSWNYYGQQMDIEEIRDHYSFYYESGGTYGEIILKEENGGFTVEGYLTADSRWSTSKTMPDMPDPGEHFVLQ